MKHFFNAVVVLFSLCLAILIAANSLSVGAYAVLILIDYILILCSNAEFRKRVKNRFKVNQTFGSGNKVYGEIHLHSLKEDIEKIDPIHFEHFVGDLFAKLGYKTKVTASKKDFGGDVIAKKGEDTIVIQVKHRNSSDWSVSNDAVQQAVAAMPVYNANKSMVVTNGEFTEHAHNQARFSKTLMIDGKQLLNLVRQVMIQESGEACSNEVEQTISNEENDRVLEESEKTNTLNTIQLEKRPENVEGMTSENLDITQADCIAKQLESVLRDTLPEVTLEECFKEKISEMDFNVDKLEEDTPQEDTISQDKLHKDKLQ